MKTSRYKGLAFALCGMLAGTAAARNNDFPPLCDNGTQEKEFHTGKFVWAELFTTDLDSAQTFYTQLFGWQATQMARGEGAKQLTYVVLSKDGIPIAGLLREPSRMKTGKHGRWIGFLSVPDVDKALETAKAAGGQILFPARAMPDRGRQAIVTDPEGANVGVLHSDTGDPGEFTPDTSEWTWAQLFARDPAAEGRFYTQLGGLEVLPDTREVTPPHLILTSGDYSRASVVPLPSRPGAKPGWLLFVRVADVKASSAAALRLGGKILVPASDTPKEYWRAIIADPTGSVLGIVQLMNTEEGKGQP